jgi:hypothetical protein
MEGIGDMNIIPLGTLSMFFILQWSAVGLGHWMLSRPHMWYNYLFAVAIMCGLAIRSLNVVIEGLMDDGQDIGEDYEAPLFESEIKLNGETN